MASKRRKSVPSYEQVSREVSQSRRTRTPEPESGPRERPVYESDEDRIRRTTLPIWTTDIRRPIVDVPASNLTAQERKSVVDYWLNVWAFLDGLQSDIGEWTGGSFRIARYEIQTSLDAIEDNADEYNIPDINKDIYREV